ncbi:ABC-2 type transport system ATP-binding protein [Rhodococcus sp. LBL1]|uniref:ABC-2 type transport system ATP-binding protein n=1 Tax=Prescottella agglutinans TaxID=1644129 RepID=A0ABT6M7Q6_9NOCA|nr:ABC transporter ATP-binding protein [Prescottella agglutinans]MDH6279801.1 ABC-2 type transport system ATP-binding protein [Prescottella agglutinans]MDH6679348.1 ABC-2 type transport system ATP-binding protein [Rhodococcus sp. LBL1]MDH6685511.1 ABC-2 type transport system ATP-binding protein [Rhodococcus sp. LBL2]
MSHRDDTVTEATASACGLVIGYEQAEVLGPVDFRIGTGITALLGRNGAGKTTLIRTLCGIIPPLAGDCSLLGVAVADGAEVRSRVGYLGHQSALATALTVAQNLGFWRDLTSTYPHVDLITQSDLIEQFDLEPILAKKVASLSRGQRQRVDLARLAMTDPKFVVLDEPLTGLDPVYAAKTRDLLRSWGKTRTVLYSTHSVPEALELASRFLIVSGRNLIELSGAGVDERSILTHLEATS